MCCKAFKYRIRPNEKQKAQLAQIFGNNRFIYNLALHTKIDAYKSNAKANLSEGDLSKMLPDLKKEHEWLKLAPAQSYQQTIKNMLTAYDHFFKVKVKGGGFPKFKRKHHRQSFRIPQGVKIKGNRLLITGFQKDNSLKIIVDRPHHGKIKSVTISKTSTEKYFASILCEIEKPDPKPSTGKSIGLDLGLKDLMIGSDGSSYDNPRIFRKYEKQLATAQRHLSRKAKGSRRFEKQKLKVARIYEKITNSRKDYLHKVTTELVNNFDVICTESLNIRGMVKNKKLSKSISDASWGGLIRMLEYKADWYSRSILKAHPFFASSQLCSSCGYKNDKVKDLKVRAWQCPECGFEHHRDINAAKNLKSECLKNKTLAGWVNANRTLRGQHPNARVAFGDLCDTSKSNLFENEVVAANPVVSTS